MMETVRIPDYSGYDFYVKIYVHVLTHNVFGPAKSYFGVNESLKKLYDVFDPIGVHLVWDGTIDYISNNNWHDNPSSNFNNIINYNYHTDGVDIYLGNDFGIDEISRAGGIGDNTAFLVSGRYLIGNGQTVIPKTISNDMPHELGHVFYLWHTFHGTGHPENDPNACAECLYSNDPNNSSWYCGDYVFDTPPDPDPGLGIYFDSNCNYIHGGQDTCGNDFDPLSDNLMSYAPYACLSSFTLGQIRRMKNAIALLPELQSTKLQEYTYVRGKNILCGFSSDFYSIYSNNLTDITIEVSSNLQVISTTNYIGRIDIQVFSLLDQDLEGQVASIIVRRNGQEVGRKNFWTGLPQTMIQNSIDGESVANPNDVNEYFVPYKLEGAGNYMWTFPGFPPIEQEPFVTGNNGWQYDYLTKYYNKMNTMIGVCGGELFIYGINECGESVIPEDGGLGVNVTPHDPSCPIDPEPNPSPILYYPNPADSLLSIDLSLQENTVYNIIVYDQYQIVKYEDTSNNVVKTVDTFNLPNGMYYLHIYNGNELLLSNILIINH